MGGFSPFCFVCEYDSLRFKLFVWFLYVCGVVFGTVMYLLVKERDRQWQLLWRLYLVTEAEPLTRQREKLRMCVCVSEVEMKWQVTVRRSMIACLRLTADAGEGRLACPAEGASSHCISQNTGRMDQMGWEGLVQHRPLFPDDCIVRLCSWHTLNVIWGQKLLLQVSACFLRRLKPLLAAQNAWRIHTKNIKNVKACLCGSVLLILCSQWNIFRS